MIRAEAQTDRAAVRAVNTEAFERTAEADLVDALRERAHPVVSLVAEHEGRIVGHIMFSPVLLVGHPELKLMGLAPMAVAPKHQRKGIGSALVRAGLERCTALGVGAVVVLGHPTYYPRFSFVPSTRWNIRCEYGRRPRHSWRSSCKRDTWRVRRARSDTTRPLRRSDVRGARSRMLPIALIALAATSLVHHVHNAQFLDDYPNMPAWLSVGSVYAAWTVAAALGFAGYLLWRSGHRVIGTVLFLAYGCYGLEALVHYLIAPLAAHSLAMHLTIGLEAAAGALLLGVVATARPDVRA